MAISAKDGRRPAPILIVDYDETLTERSTPGALVDAAIDAQVRAAEAPSSAEDATARKSPKMCRSELCKVRDGLVANYVTQFSAFMQEQLRSSARRRAPGLDMEVASAFMDNLNAFEQRMNDRVVHSRILAGLQVADIEAAARQVVLRPGAVSVLRRALAEGWHVHVLSVNWSATWIRTSLGDLPCNVVAGDSTIEPPEMPSGAVHIHANDLETRLGVTTGDIHRRLEGPVDKGNLLEDILLSFAAATGDGSTACVYVGDSVGDVAALLAASVPIMLGSNDCLHQVLQMFGCHVTPIECASFQAGTAASGEVYQAGAWSQVSAFLFGQSDGPCRADAKGGARCEEQAVVNGVRQVEDSDAVHRQVERAGVGDDGGSRIAPPRVLVIAGSDSGGGAGMQADIKACMANGAFASTAVTALTAQNSQGVQAVHVPPRPFLDAQIRAVIDDIGADAIKTGMLPDAETVMAVHEAVIAWRQHGGNTYVLDPVLVSGAGNSLADAEATTAIRGLLLPIATVMTPNIQEAEALLGGGQITSVDDMKQAARDLLAMGSGAVYLKGGHVPVSDENRSHCIDVLCTSHTMLELPTPRIETHNSHGTGCTLASAMAAHLACGATVEEAARRAQRYVATCVARSTRLNLGDGPQGAMDHGAGLERSARARGATRRYALYAVTDSAMNARHGRTMRDAVDAAARGGATMIQLREKEADGGAFLRDVAEAVEVCRPHGVPVIVNDRVDVALAAGADGVHVGQSDLPCSMVRTQLGASAIVGVSCTTSQEASAAIAAGADYIGCGACYATATKDSAAIGTSGVRAVVEHSSVPVVAIGGINAGNAAQVVLESGCAGVALVSALFDQADVLAATRDVQLALAHGEK